MVVERAMHARFAACRENPAREFFRIPACVAREALMGAGGILREWPYWDG